VISIQSTLTLALSAVLALMFVLQVQFLCNLQYRITDLKGCSSEWPFFVFAGHGMPAKNHFDDFLQSSK
jgi:hypothetical protein